MDGCSCWWTKSSCPWSPWGCSVLPSTACSAGASIRSRANIRRRHSLPAGRATVMWTRGAQCLLVVSLLAWSAAAWAQTKMTIATGVDPVFSAYYVAQQEGLFKKHGLDVRINTGPSGSAMVSFLINGQIESAFGSEIAGVSNHNLDPNVVVVAQATRLVRWIAVVGRNIDNLDQLKGKKVGVARGSGGEGFWLAMLDKLKLNAADYTVVNVEAPEMVAALERGNIERETSTIGMFRLAEAQLKQQGKLSKPLDYGAFVYPDLLRKVQPVKVNYKP